MIFNILILGLVGAVAYFHYAQGLFSAFLSTVIAAIAATVAVGFHEQVFAALGKGQMADVSLGAILVALYAGTYVLLRVLMDMMVPGNVNFGVMGDRIGAGVCGVFAGLFTAGILALAAQSLPFGPSILGYSRWESETRHIELGTTPDWARVGRDRNGITDFLFNYNELKMPAFDKDHPNVLNPANASTLWIPADDFVAAFVGKVSGGALSGDKPWLMVHPSYPNELFAARIGIQPGAKKTAFPLNKSSQVEVVQVVKGPAAGFGTVIDGDIPAFRIREEKLPEELRAGEGQTLVVLRLQFKRDAAEKDGKVRFSTGSIRLCAGGKNYYPIGVLRDDETVIFQHPDDFLILDADTGVDAVFSVGVEDFYGAGNAADSAKKVGPDVFVEFKRLSHAEIGGKDVEDEGKLDESDEDLVKKFRGSVLRRDTWANPEGPGGSGGKKKGKKK